MGRVPATLITVTEATPTRTPLAPHTTTLGLGTGSTTTPRGRLSLVGRVIRPATTTMPGPATPTTRSDVAAQMFVGCGGFFGPTRQSSLYLVCFFLYRDLLKHV